MLSGILLGLFVQLIMGSPDRNKLTDVPMAEVANGEAGNMVVGSERGHVAAERACACRGEFCMCQGAMTSGSNGKLLKITVLLSYDSLSDIISIRTAVDQTSVFEGSINLKRQRMLCFPIKSQPVPLHGCVFVKGGNRRGQLDGEVSAGIVSSNRGWRRRLLKAKFLLKKHAWRPSEKGRQRPRRAAGDYQSSNDYSSSNPATEHKQIVHDFGIQNAPKNDHKSQIPSSQDYGVQSAPSHQSAPSQDYGVQSAPSQDYGVQHAPSQDYGVQHAPSQDYGVQHAPSQDYGVQSAPSHQSAPSQDYGVQSAPSHQSAPSQDYGIQHAPSQDYGVQHAPSQDYGVQHAPSQDYGVQSAPSQDYGIQHAPSQDYGIQSAPSQDYGVQSAPSQDHNSNSNPLSCNIQSFPADQSGLVGYSSQTNQDSQPDYGTRSSPADNSLQSLPTDYDSTKKRQRRDTYEAKRIMKDFGICNSLHIKPFHQPNQIIVSRQVVHNTQDAQPNEYDFSKHSKGVLLDYGIYRHPINFGSQNAELDFGIASQNALTDYSIGSQNGLRDYSVASPHTLPDYVTDSQNAWPFYAMDSQNAWPDYSIRSWNAQPNNGILSQNPQIDFGQIISAGDFVHRSE